MQDRLSDLVTRLRNAYLVGKPEVAAPHTKLLESVTRVMLEEKYLAGVEVKDTKPGKTLVLTLAYADHRPAIQKIKRISKPGVRIYSRHHASKPVLSGLGIRILSTSQGVMTDRVANTKKLGGEVLVELW